jgi:hypothetical protein
MTEFTRNLEEINYKTQKINLIRNLQKNYIEHIHYIIIKDKFKMNKQNGGQNKVDFMLTEEAFDLLQNSYNLRNKYIVAISGVKCVNIGMCIETQTIGFIENSFTNVLNIKRQYCFGKYRVDLYFIDYKLVVECDENNHEDRDIIYEKAREEYIISL